MVKIGRTVGGMKAFPLLSLFALSLATPLVHAQEDTATHRKLYAEINEAAPKLRKVEASFQEDVTEFALTGWLDGSDVRKILARCSDGGVEEIYLENGNPLFVFTTWFKATEDGAKGAKVEERLYLKNGEVFKWLSTEKPAPVLHSEDYQATTERIVTNTKQFVAALKKKAGPAAKVAAGASLEGVFTGIEEGDYAHWTMKTAAGERSFFILKPHPSIEQALAQPAKFKGKRCRITWKKSMEEIPEAGGRMEVEQVLDVRWID